MDVVLDLETLGTSSDSAILAIGAVSLGDSVFYRRIKSPTGAVSIETIRWWMGQSEVVRLENWSGGDAESDVLHEFGAWLTAVRDKGDGKLRLWGSEDFDTGILKEAYARNKLPLPWHYREPRGLRTAFDLLDIDEDSEPWGNRIEHIAIDCAIQAAILLGRALAAHG